MVWVQSDRAEARRRGLVRDIEQGRLPRDADRVWDDWMRMEEEPFLAADRPWTRAGLVVNSTPDGPPDPGSAGSPGADSRSSAMTGCTGDLYGARLAAV